MTCVRKREMNVFACIHVNILRLLLNMICHKDGENAGWLSLVINIVLSALRLSNGPMGWPGGLEMGG